MKQISDKLKASLPQLQMANLGSLDRGAVARRVNEAISLAANNISKYPFRDGGKVEARKVVIEIVMTPMIEAVKIGVEGAGRQYEADGFELTGICTRVKVKSALPDAETADIKMLCEMKSGAITDIRFNPQNNMRPEQLELDLEPGDDAPDDDEDDDDDE